VTSIITQAKAKGYGFVTLAQLLQS